MDAYKFLGPGRYSLLTGFRWPVGEWVEVRGPLVASQNGIHGCRVADLPHWLDEVLWRVELGGDLIQAERTVVARSGRLLEPVTAWTARVQSEFASACAARDRGLGPADAAAGWVPSAGAAYIAAHGAGLEAEAAGGDYEEGFAAERAWQARWLADRLGL